MVLLFAIPSLLFLGGLGMMMWAEAKCTRRDENEREPMFVKVASLHAPPVLFPQ